jgi:hypothetical protein
LQSCFNRITVLAGEVLGFENSISGCSTATSMATIGDTLASRSKSQYIDVVHFFSTGARLK